LAHEHDHHHPHAGEWESAPEEQLDPGHQSLADALRASFRILKLVMVIVIVVFLVSGVFTVDQDKEVVVLLRFGDRVGVYRDGLHWGWPYPVGEVIEVPIAPRTMTVDAFFLNIPDTQKGRSWRELSQRGPGLNPAVDGALLTSDRAIMHMLLKAQYRIANPELFVEHVERTQAEDNETHGEHLLRSVLQNASVAVAARTTADELWKGPGDMVAAVRRRAQETLDDLQTGIRLENVAADQSYYPLQVKLAVLSVVAAQDLQNTMIQQARTMQQDILNEAAGPAWKALRDEIERLDEVPGGGVDGRIVDTSRINEILDGPEAAGKARELIEEAKQERERIVLTAEARENEFDLLLKPYRENPELFRQRLLKDMLEKLYAESGVKKWILPAGNKAIGLWLSQDPKEYREAEEARIRAAALAEQQRKQAN